MADGLRVVLVAPRNPLNIGAAARAMSNFGFFDLRLVKPYDVAYREAKSAVKSEYILERAQVFDTVAEAVADSTLVVGSTSAANRELHVPLYRLEAAGALLRDVLKELLRDAAPKGNLAVLFGSEKFGLSNDDMSHCHWLFRIPSREEHGSMNLGQAVAITLYELRREQQAESPTLETPARAEGAEFERITALFYKLLSDSGYIQERMADQSEIRLRQLVMRLGISASDAKTWQGILRQIQWKVDHGSKP